MTSVIDSKEKLVAALQEAVTVEHGLLCQYLFAAFSLKQRQDEGVTPLQLEQIREWKAMILKVARQEMGHLGTVCNLLAAIGEKPRFDNLDFPQENPYFTVAKVHFILEPFGLPSLHRFVRFEVPENNLKPAAYFLFKPKYKTVGGLYDQIKRGFQVLSRNNLFVGQSVETEDVNNRRDITITKVTNLESAEKAIQSIIEEGEGGSTNSNTATSHYAKFKQIEADLHNFGSAFQPARAVASSPRLTEDAKRPEIAVIHNEQARAVGILFNHVYSTMVLMIVRVWQIPNELVEQDKLQPAQAMARQLMSGILRPLGEILTELPLGNPAAPQRAGATFELDMDVNTPGDVQATWALFHERLQQAAQLAAAAVHSLPGNKRLAIVQENLQLLVRVLERSTSTISTQTLHNHQLAHSATKTGITIHFEGWFQYRLATDPDPADEPRGASGWTFALGNEPDLDHILRLQDAVAPRIWGGEYHDVGVVVRSVEVQGQTDAHHSLVGARVDLLDQPMFVGRNGIVSDTGAEFIAPFRLSIQTPSITIERVDHLDPSAPNKALVDIAPHLWQRRQPVAAKIKPGDYAAYRMKRKKVLEGDLASTTDALVRAVLQKRITELARHDSPEQALGFSLDYAFELNGLPVIIDPQQYLADAIDEIAFWPIEFSMGEWDADALCGYMKGSIVLPFK